MGTLDHGVQFDSDVHWVAIPTLEDLSTTIELGDNLFSWSSRQ